MPMKLARAALRSAWRSALCAGPVMADGSRVVLDMTGTLWFF
ncbi:hypothetical protein METHP14_160050 [Pseudomonas sp. P14-2025]